MGTSDDIQSNLGPSEKKFSEWVNYPEPLRSEGIEESHLLPEFASLYGIIREEMNDFQM